jgi:hypothetical protein
VNLRRGVEADELHLGRHHNDAQAAC